MIELIVTALLVVGTAFMLLASVGMLRMPDVYTRLQVSTKGASLGAASVLLAVPFFFAQPAIAVRAVLIILFIFLTAPISAHMLGRAAYIVGVPLWRHSVRDELAGRYHPETQELSSPPEVDDGTGIA